MFGMSLAGPCMLLSIEMALLNWNVRHFLLNFLGLFVLGLVRSKLKASSLRGQVVPLSRTIAKEQDLPCRTIPPSSIANV
jgi:hypothetical protein